MKILTYIRRRRKQRLGPAPIAPTDEYNAAFEAVQAGLKKNQELLEQLADAGWCDRPKPLCLAAAGERPFALAHSHVAALEQAILAEGYDILVDPQTGQVTLSLRVSSRKQVR